MSSFKVTLPDSVKVTLPSSRASLVVPLGGDRIGKPGPQGPEGPPASPLAKIDAAKSALLDPRDADSTIEWAGGDAADNIRTAGGKDLFFWGDTFLGDVTEDGRWGGGNYTDFQRRTVTMIDPTTGATTLYDEDSALLTPLKTLPGGAPGEWAWFSGVAGTDGGPRAYAFAQGIVPTGGDGAFAFASSGRTYLAEVDISGAAPTLVKWDLWRTETLPAGIGFWADAAWQDADGYVYTYGYRSAGGAHDVYAARVPVSNVWGVQEVWNGAGWASSGAAPIGRFPFVPTGVRKLGDAYYALVAPFYGLSLEVWSSSSITSGWAKVGDAWSYPKADELFYYAPRWVPQWDDPSGLAVIVPHNAKPGTTLEPMDYVPDVIRISRLIAPLSSVAGAVAAEVSTPGTEAHDAVVAAATSIATDTAVPINRLPAGTVISTTSATTRPSTRSDLVCLWLGADPGSNALGNDVWLGS